MYLGWDIPYGSMILQVPTGSVRIRKVFEHAKLYSYRILTTNLIHDKIEVTMTHKYTLHHNFEPDIILQKLKHL
jgi:hypothetical protein